MVHESLNTSSLFTSLRLVQRASVEEEVQKSKKFWSTQLLPCVCVSECVMVLVFNFHLHFLFQGIFPACYIHLKEATVEGSGWELFHSCGVFPPTFLFSRSELHFRKLRFFLNLQLKRQKWGKPDCPKSFRNIFIFLYLTADLTRSKSCFYLSCDIVCECCENRQSSNLVFANWHPLPPDKKKPWYLLICR